MKTIPAIQFVFVVLCVCLPASKGFCQDAMVPAPLPKADPLLPESDGQLIARIQQLFDELAARRPDYGLTVESVTVKGPPGWPSRIGGTLHIYRTAPPSYVSERLAQVGFDCSKRGSLERSDALNLWMSQLHEHLLAAEHSFDAAVLAISSGLLLVTPPPTHVRPVLDGQRDAWQADYNTYANVLVGGALGIRPYCHRRELFLQLLGVVAPMRRMLAAIILPEKLENV